MAFLMVVGEHLLLDPGPELVQLAELIEELLQFVSRWSERHVPSFIRRRASAMSAAGVFCVFFWIA